MAGDAATGPGAAVDPTVNVLNLVREAIVRQDDLRDLEAAHQKYVAELRAAHAQELRAAETERINAIRAVDVGAVNRAAEVAATQAGALAAQLIATAEASRVQVAAAASASVTSLAAALEPIQKDIRDLRDAQSRGQGGKEQVVETREVRGETRLNTGTNLTAVSVLIGALILAVALYAALHP
jgi:hypothetical protein